MNIAAPSRTVVTRSRVGAGGPVTARGRNSAAAWPAVITRNPPADAGPCGMADGKLMAPSS